MRRILTLPLTLILTTACFADNDVDIKPGDPVPVELMQAAIEQRVNNTLNAAAQNNMVSVLRMLKAKNDIATGRIAQLELEVSKLSSIDKDLAISESVAQIKTATENETVKLKVLEEAVAKLESMPSVAETLVTRVTALEVQNKIIQNEAQELLTNA